MRLKDIMKLMRMNLLFISLIFILFICPFAVFSQISEGGTPPSFKYQETSLRSGNPIIKVPVDFYIEDLRETDDWQAREGAPKPVSKLISVDYTMENSGFHTILPSGENIWRLHLKADDAVMVMLYYSDFYIPQGGRLFIYSPDQCQLLGAYTNRTHPSGGLFATEFIGGDELILEYVASDTSEEKPRIRIAQIGYGYNAIALHSFCGDYPTGKSGDCNVNINCEEGDAWQNEKKGVCFMMQKIGNSCYICTASLMNNTAEDFKPLILSANHCAYNGSYSSRASAEDMMQWVFYFHREREDCNNTSLGIAQKTMTGCRLLVSTGLGGGSDGMLLQLNDMIPEDYNVFYNGWDVRGEAALSGVCIHHPSGDYKKISTYSAATEAFTWRWEFTAARLAHWNVYFKETANGFGITEDGSSGSPLYNENKLVIGTLTGGGSTCTYPRGRNLYGSMNFHWYKFPTDSSTRMDVWLDPLNRGVKTLSGRFQKPVKPVPRNLKAVFLGQSFSLSWESPPNSESLIRYNVYRNNVKIGETVSLSFTDYEPTEGSIVYAVSAVYADEIESNFVSTTSSFIKHKPPTDLKAERSSPTSEVVKISWQAPVYKQTIYWGNPDEYRYCLGYERREQFYFGHRWTADEISPLHRKTIQSVQFMPVENNVYDIFISQGERTYRQRVDTDLQKDGKLNTVDLETPFVIDGTKSLIVSIYTAVVRTTHPAWLDEGPVVAGKGNVRSFDGKDWGQLLDDNSTYDNNFIVAAVISSETGNLTENKVNSLQISDIFSGNPNVQPRSDLRAKANIQLSETNESAIRIRQSAVPLTEQTILTQNAVPALFPEITKYRIYRNESHHREIVAPTTSYTENYENTSSLFYEITAFYDRFESERSERVYVTIVDNEYRGEVAVHIYPTLFTNSLSIHGHEFVSKIEVISVIGKICLVENNPKNTIDTSSLAPGLYFLRIYDIYNNLKIIKAVKSP